MSTEQTLELPPADPSLPPKPAPLSKEEEESTPIAHTTYYSDPDWLVVACRHSQGDLVFVVKHKSWSDFKIEWRWTRPDGVLLFPLASKRVRMPPFPAKDPQTHLDLFRDLGAHMASGVTVSKPFSVVMAAWALGTWMFGRFGSYPYLHFRGDTGKGKTRAMETLQSIVCRPTKIWTEVTEAVLFRIVTEAYPTLFLDEVDAELPKQYRAVLRTGFTRGASVPRTRELPGGGHRTEDFPTFCPKVLGGQHPINDNAFVSRVLEENMMENSPDAKIPEFLTVEEEPTFFHRARSLEARQLRWAFDNYFSLTTKRNTKASRENQVFAPLFSVTPKELHPALRRVIDQYQVDATREAGETMEGMTAQAILRVLPTMTQDKALFPGLMAQEMMRFRSGTGWKRLRPGNPGFISSQAVATAMRRLGLEKMQRSGVRGQPYLLTIACYRNLQEKYSPRSDREDRADPASAIGESS